MRVLIETFQYTAEYKASKKCLVVTVEKGEPCQNSRIRGLQSFNRAHGFSTITVSILAGQPCQPASPVKLLITESPLADLPIAASPIAGLPPAQYLIIELSIADLPIAGLTIAELSIADSPIADAPIAESAVVNLPNNELPDRRLPTCLLAEKTIALAVTLSGGALFAS